MPTHLGLGLPETSFLKPDFQKTILLHIDDSFSDPEQCLSGSQLCYNGTSIVLSDKNNLMSYKVLLSYNSIKEV